MKIYVPTYNNGNCLVVQNEEVIRVYESTPVQNASVNYIDYYVNSHYLSRSGVQQFGQFTTIPTCYSPTDITSSVYYRFDITSILICFIIILIFCFYFPYRLVSRCLGRWLKL